MIEEALAGSCSYILFKDILDLNTIFQIVLIFSHHSQSSGRLQLIHYFNETKMKYFSTMIKYMNTQVTLITYSIGPPPNQRLPAVASISPLTAQRCISSVPTIWSYWCNIESTIIIIIPRKNTRTLTNCKNFVKKFLRSLRALCIPKYHTCKIWHSFMTFCTEWPIQVHTISCY